MAHRHCSAQKDDGTPCRAPALTDGTFCFWHDPAHAEEAAEARRLGGLRRRRERAVAGAYELDGLDSVSDIRRVLMVAAVDALGLENSVPRVRALIAVVMAGTKLLETGELEQRIDALEAAV